MQAAQAEEKGQNEHGNFEYALRRDGLKRHYCSFLLHPPDERKFLIGQIQMNDSIRCSEWSVTCHSRAWGSSRIHIQHGS